MCKTVFKLSSLFHAAVLGLLLVTQPFNQAWSNPVNSHKALEDADKLAPTHSPYQRIISLAPHITEMLYSAGAGGKLVGVVSYSDYPPAALELPIVGRYSGINLEKIIALHPDLILAWRSGNRLQDIERLRELGFKVRLSDIQTLDDIPDEIEQLGRLTGQADHALNTANQLRTTLRTVRERYQNSQAISTFYEIWHQPLITMNGQQFISQALGVCGAKNVFSDLMQLTSEVSLESIFERDPQLFFLGGQKAFQKDWLESWQRYPTLTAIKNRQVYLLNNNLYQRPTARLINALDGLCRKVDQARHHYQAQQRH